MRVLAALLLCFAGFAACAAEPCHWPDEEKFVYIISNKSFPGWYKVGMANDPQARLNNFQTGDPHRAYKLEFQMKTPCYREIEKRVIRKFADRYEWARGNLVEIKGEIGRLHNSCLIRRGA